MSTSTAVAVSFWKSTWTYFFSECRELCVHLFYFYFLRLLPLSVLHCSIAICWAPWLLGFFWSLRNVFIDGLDFFLFFCLLFLVHYTLTSLQCDFITFCFAWSLLSAMYRRSFFWFIESVFIDWFWFSLLAPPGLLVKSSLPEILVAPKSSLWEVLYSRRCVRFCWCISRFVFQ